RHVVDGKFVFICERSKTNKKIRHIFRHCITPNGEAIPTGEKRKHKNKVYLCKSDAELIVVDNGKKWKTFAVQRMP
ncbi:hypothetical protein PMAYCL1PPCAC_19019, partial [Pristionchus mayeri]